MNDQVKCPHCGKVFEMTQAIAHLVKKEKLQVEEERVKLRADAQKWREEQLIKFEKDSQKKNKELEEKMRQKVKEEMDLQIRDKSEEIGELRKQNKGLQDQLLELTKSIRQLRTENEIRRLEDEKKLQVKEDEIRKEEKKRADESNRMKLLEYEKKINDVSKVNEDLKRKLEQGSQQLQGEVLELELENILRKEFPYDEIKKVSTGVTGADVVQTVKNNYGKPCGIIIWESKRTKAWSDGWITKLKEDQRRVKAEIAVIISQVLPDGVKRFTQKDKVWIGDYESIYGLGLLLRNTLFDLSAVKSSVIGKQEKKEILWNYLTSTEFRQRLDAIYDSYNQAKVYLDKEKEFFRRKWAREDKNIQLMMESLLGVHGDLQAIIGKSLPEIKGFDMLPAGNKEKNDTLF
ncbi:hypothetical protein A2767_04460 [Candidatus Roizmanbacteria bacterium RIFCSPHIGHO2_01_FULL_35_10]|uniref:Uncharacterized protein n=1 Tax=Candidatus Roizmanbacteria bacterium RIFCSPLOWO2_01_FULL_35_13 TaxID=1802055 RepID=A0A1F7IH44_9BACT|nr:MAG: hypothetical protein A2767_04460 [Candidatus Roizmanbacteria bacterium RIFCSPHIGHO2_01_FULL_35_10]OGK42653.1 MAG: hypothetical protein A3A74_06490 [Candidatus Roizmanbacteria bacterium RIFCSPLOWO2_01_FULL_35_13]